MHHEIAPSLHGVEVGPLIWIVVADGGRARILSPMHHDKGPLEERAQLDNDDARIADQETLSDRSGRVTQGPGGIGHAFEPRTTHREHVVDGFARTLCQRLDKVRVAGELSKLYLLAAPHFLGLMRKHLDKDTNRLVAGEYAVDLVQHPAIDIRKALPGLL